MAVPEVRDMLPKQLGVAWDTLLGRLNDSQAAKPGEPTLGMMRYNAEKLKPTIC